MDSQYFANTFQQLRKDAHMTQKEIAEKLGVTPTAVSKWERGLSYPDITLLPRLAVMLDYDIESLLRGAMRYNAERWIGVLDISRIRLDRFDLLTKFMFDKPLVHFLIGYFLLAGIKDVVILYNMNVPVALDELQKCLMPLEKGGVRFRYITDIDTSVISAKHLMVLYESCFIYGVDLTRHFQRIMTEERGITLCFSKSKYGYTKPVNLTIDSTDGVVRTSDNKRDFFHTLPLLFIHKDLAFELLDNNKTFDYDSVLCETRQVYGEVFPRGMIIRRVSTLAELVDVAAFVRDVERYQGEKICDIEEIMNSRKLRKLD